MKLCNKEIEAIKVSESYHNNKLSFLKRLLFQKFKFTRNEVPKNKTMLELWKIYGLRNKTNFSFTKEEQLKCMSEWFDILHSKEFDYINAYEQSVSEFNASARKTIKENPGIHFNWILPNPENFLENKTSEFGSYI